MNAITYVTHSLSGDDLIYPQEFCTLFAVSSAYSDWTNIGIKA